MNGREDFLEYGFKHFDIEFEFEMAATSGV
jgi:hypothetical protein